MNNRFKSKDEKIYEKMDIASYSKMDIEGFFRTKLPQLARMAGEPWDCFAKRRNESCKELSSFVFGTLKSKDFELDDMPEEYEDYQYVQKSEFRPSSKIIVFSGVISINRDEMIKLAQGEECDETKLTTIETASPKYNHALRFINDVAIGEPLKYWKIESELIKNTRNYILNSSDSNGIIGVSKWLQATGKSGRTKALEATAEGSKLLWEIYYNEYNIPIIEILSPEGRTVGEINWRAEDENDREYSEVYEPLLTTGCVSIESIVLKKIIPHNTPEGRPRKAMAQVCINFHVEDLPDESVFIENAIRGIQTMRTLAAIDYNRKCDIINGAIPDRLNSIEDLFCEGDKYNCKFLFSFDLFSRDDFLSGQILTNEELAEFWNVFLPSKVFFNLLTNEDLAIMCSDQEGNILYCKRNYLQFALEIGTKEIQINGEPALRNKVTITVYRNE